MAYCAIDLNLQHQLSAGIPAFVCPMGWRIYATDQTAPQLFRVGYTRTQNIARTPNFRSLDVVAEANRAGPMVKWREYDGAAAGTEPVPMAYDRMQARWDGSMRNPCVNTLLRL